MTKQILAFLFCFTRELNPYSPPGRVKSLGGKRAKTLSLQETGQRADSVHPVERSHSFYHLDIHTHPRERAGMENRGGSAVGAKYIVRGRKTRHKLY